jgi:hypothetical protein
MTPIRNWANNAYRIAYIWFAVRDVVAADRHEVLEGKLLQRIVRRRRVGEGVIY